MRKIMATAAAAALAATLGTQALADDRAVVQSFYTAILSGTTKADLAERVAGTLAPSWASVGDYSGTAKTREQFVKQLQGFGKLVPDLAWSIEEIVQAGNRYVVRGRATGTPAGEFFGAPPSGKRFEIMSIDMHTVEGGKITRSYHVEDWAGALRQLKAN
ncbi:MAG: ester cyclase [Alphaproteobacteria bacterium]|nr:ester cyclase [Alphaproteobacteria bacterium]